MKTIKATHIDTGGHGYLSVSKKDFIRAGADIRKISGSSGHTTTRIYLEEDGDQNYFWDIAKANGFEIVRKSGYNLKFNITHGYNWKLFHYIPSVDDIVSLSDGMDYKIIEIRPNGSIIVMNLKSRMQYRISGRNPFEHIKHVKSEF
jgi:hypothetical protein